MIDEMEQARAALYRLLGTALSHPPTAALLDRLRALPASSDGSPIANALARVARTAQQISLAAARTEYDARWRGCAKTSVRWAWRRCRTIRTRRITPARSAN
jgi:TorA maturation chaperone TorD